jgi:hypothetical protein
MEELAAEEDLMGDSSDEENDEDRELKEGEDIIIKRA